MPKISYEKFEQDRWLLRSNASRIKQRPKSIWKVEKELRESRESFFLRNLRVQEENKRVVPDGYARSFHPIFRWVNDEAFFGILIGIVAFVVILAFACMMSALDESSDNYHDACTKWSRSMYTKGLEGKVVPVATYRAFQKQCVS